ncbi:ERCC4 domain-containing protein [Tissierella sp.]|uniref:ERCC4 domain-containing protein n=1 Tax=Tissierella sp. TaxID=41274 RepID=UPI002857931F|nr:ERCC4 domain-containing protein [Tissierella sp.]MDR7856102.1 ERCC4 domain-containing protein [Tissierella sp.]
MIQMYKYTDKEIDVLLKSMVILVDTREQVNQHLTQYWDSKKFPYIVKKLDFADYTCMIPSNPELGIIKDLYFNDIVSVERKNSLEEISSCFTTTRTAFEGEFIRSKGNVHLLIEKASYEDVINHNYKTEYKPVSFLASLHSFSDRYNIPITYMKDNKYSGYFIYMTFKYAVRNYLLNK